ncbi:MAG: ankyrin repeat domain-containing protein [Gemmatimonadota bacterium]
MRRQVIDSVSPEWRSVRPWQAVAWSFAAMVLLAAGVSAQDAPVAEAARRGDLARVRALVSAGTDVNVPLGDGMTALHWAAERRDTGMTALLLRSRAGTAATTRIGSHTPLHIAGRSGSGEVVRLLLDGGADVNALTAGGASALHLAALAGSVPAVTVLLERGAVVNVRESAWRQTPLMFAASANQTEVVKVLLAHKADAALLSTTIDLVEEEKREQAATRKRNEVLMSFLPEKMRDSIRAAEARNATAMARPGGPGGAAGATQPQQGAVAASAGSSTAALRPDSTQSPAAAPPPPPASQRGGLNTPPTSSLSADQIQQAIAAGRAALAAPAAGPATEVADTADGQIAGYAASVGRMGGLTALHHATRQGHAEAALALIDGGADINTPSASDSTTPLLMAIINGHYDLAVELVARKANVNVASVVGMTPLYAAINTMWAPRSRYPQPQSVQYQKRSHIDLMKALLAAGADPNTRIRRQPWYFAYNNCGNANCGLENIEGTAAFWRAAYAVDVDAMRLLKEHGADVTIASRPPVRGRGARPGGGGGPDGPPTAGAAGAAGGADAEARNAAIARRAAGAAGAAPGAGATPTAAGAGAGAPERQAFAGGNFDPGAGRLPADMDSAARAVPPGAGVLPVHAAAGVGYGNGFAGNSHRHAPEGWLPAMKYLVEELGADVNARDNNGYTPLHHAAARGDNEMILYLVSKGADVKAVARNGRTTVDMANGPVQRLRPYPETIALLEKLGAKNNHRCVGC